MNPYVDTLENNDNWVSALGIPSNELLTSDVDANTSSIFHVPLLSLTINLLRYVNVRVELSVFGSALKLNCTSKVPPSLSAT